MSKWNSHPTPPPPQPIHQVGVSVRNPQLQMLSSASGTLKPDTYDVTIVGEKIDPPGRILFTIPSNIPFPDWGYWGTFSAPGFVTQQLRIIPKESLSYDIVLEEDVTPLPRLVINGKFFEGMNIVMCSDFNILNRVKDGTAEAIIKQRREVGYNCLRIFTYYDIPQIGTFRGPDRYDYFAALSKLCAKFNLYVNAIGFTSIKDYSHWDSLVNAVAPFSNIFLSLVNENDQPANTIDVGAFALPTLTSRGSNGSALPNPPYPPTPISSWTEMHWNIALEWVRKVGHNSMDVANTYNVPCLPTEMKRAPDNYHDHQAFYDIGRSSSLLAGGICFHSVRGKTSELWDGIELACAQSCADGANSVEPRFHVGEYLHRQDLETPNTSRVYSRRLGNGEECIATIGNYVD